MKEVYEIGFVFRGFVVVSYIFKELIVETEHKINPDLRGAFISAINAFTETAFNKTSLEYLESGNILFIFKINEIQSEDNNVREPIILYGLVDKRKKKTGKLVKKFLEKGLTIEIKPAMEEGGVPRFMPTVPWGAFTSYLDNFKGTVGNHRLSLDKHIKEHIETLNKEVQLLKDSVSNAVNNQIEKFNEETLTSKEKTSQYWNL